jgi:hypothetical protein
MTWFTEDEVYELIGDTDEFMEYIDGISDAVSDEGYNSMYVNIYLCR